MNLDNIQFEIIKYAEKSYEKNFEQYVLNNKKFFKELYIKLLIEKAQQEKNIYRMFTKKKIIFFQDTDLYLLAKEINKNKIIIKVFNIKKIINFIYKISLIFLFKKNIISYKFRKIKKKNLIILNQIKYYNYYRLLEKKILKTKKNFLLGKTKNYIHKLKFFENNNFKFSKFFKNNIVRSEIKQNLIILIYYYSEFLAPQKFEKIISFEGDTVVHQIINFLKKSDSQSICFQWGSFTTDQIKYGFKHMYFDKYFVWSHYYKKKFKIHNLNTKFIVTGNPLINHSNNNKKYPVILLNPKETSISDSEEDVLRDIIKYYINQCNKKVILRYHPSDDRYKRFVENLDEKKIIYHNPYKFNLNYTLSKGNIFFSIKSSSLVEAINYKSLVFSVARDVKYLEPFFKILKKNKLNFYTFKSIINRIDYLSKNKKNMKKTMQVINYLAHMHTKYIGEKSLNFIRKNII